MIPYLEYWVKFEGFWIFPSGHEDRCCNENVCIRFFPKIYFRFWKTVNKTLKNSPDQKNSKFWKKLCSSRLYCTLYITRGGVVLFCTVTPPPPHYTWDTA